jgi:OHCU decarboxylase
MAERRPFAGRGRLAAAAGSVWRALAPGDWREAFAAHPRIGERAEPQARGHGGEETAARWSTGEQAGTSGASGEILAALAEANRAYEDRFGMTYIVCATGRSAEEMLALCQERLANDPAAELRAAAEEQLRITGLRLDKLLRGEA